MPILGVKMEIVHKGVVVGLVSLPSVEKVLQVFRVQHPGFGVCSSGRIIWNCNAYVSVPVSVSVPPTIFPLTHLLT